MTKKDFQAIADVLARHKDGMSALDFHLFVTDLMEVFEEINPRFDQKRFLAACGIDPKEG